MNSLDKATELKRRTKSFAIRIVNLFRSLPRAPDAQPLESNFCAPVLRSPQIIERFAVLAPTLSSFQRWEMWSKKQMKPFFGLSF